MGLPTVRDVLDLPLLRSAEPQVLAAEGSLEACVRWVHVSELADIGPLLRGNELLLTTGIAMPSAPAELRAYVAGLVNAGVSALVIELGRRFAELPRALVSACESLALPLIALRRPVPFVAITEAAHTLVLSARATLADAADGFQDRLLDLALSGAAADDIVRHLSAHLRLPVVLESTMHEVLAHACPEGVTVDLLRDWESRSRGAQHPTQDGTAGQERWLVHPVGAVGGPWGRLVVLGPARVTTDQNVATQRAAAVLTLVHRARGVTPALNQARSRVLASILLEEPVAVRDAHATVEALGVQLKHRRLVVAVIVPGGDSADGQSAEQFCDRIFSAAIVGSARPLIGAIAPGRLAAIVPFTAQDDARDVVSRFARLIAGQAAALYGRERHVTVATAAPFDRLERAAQAFAEASLVADAAVAQDGPVGYPCAENVSVAALADCPLGALMAATQRGVQANSIADRLLHPILVHDASSQDTLLPVLRSFLRHVDNKTAAAASAHLSRPAFYQRIARAEGILGLRLDDSDVRAALQAALSLRSLSRAKALD